MLSKNLIKYQSLWMGTSQGERALIADLEYVSWEILVIWVRIHLLGNLVDLANIGYALLLVDSMP